MQKGNILYFSFLPTFLLREGLNQDQAGLKLRDLSATFPRILSLQACITKTQPQSNKTQKQHPAQLILKCLGYLKFWTVLILPVASTRFRLVILV